MDPCPCYHLRSPAVITRNRVLALVDFVPGGGGEGCLAARLAPWAPGSPLSVAFGFPRKS